MVTGLGIVSPIGNTVAEAWENALAGKSGITRITRFDPARLASQIAGEGALPRLRDGISDRADDAQPGDHDSAASHL